MVTLDAASVAATITHVATTIHYHIYITMCHVAMHYTNHITSYHDLCGV